MENKCECNCGYKCNHKNIKNYGTLEFSKYSVKNYRYLCEICANGHQIKGVKND